MPRARLAVLSVIAKQMTVTAAAVEYGYSRRQVQRLLARYRDEGLDAVEPRSRRPKSNPAATPSVVRGRVVELRLELVKDGLDAGPVTIAWHLEQEGHRPPSTSTIPRILHTAELVVPEPRKRPRSSYRRFAAAQPNECWQSDFTHWRLAQGKIERWHQTLKRWLAQQPPAATIADLQSQLDTFRELYNHRRPHRELDRRTPATAYAALPKATAPAHDSPEHYRLRYNTVDTNGKMSFRRAGRMHHLGIGAANTGKRALAIADDTTITVIHLDTGELLSAHTIDLNRHYWRNTQKAPGRWPETP